MTVITLTTDFGSGDHEAGVLKGVIWRIAPQACIADLSHDIAAQDILEGALLLWRSTRYFPAGSIHVAVVDPGVGTRRRGTAGRVGDQYFVGPDNGLFTLVLERGEQNGWQIEWVELDQPRFWLAQVSRVFHGRDVFSPVAAHLANGVPLSELGTPLHDPVRLVIPQPQQTGAGWQAHILHIDHFGNLATDLPVERLKNLEQITVRIGEAEIRGLAETFGSGQPGELLAVGDSSGLLTIAQVNGSAAFLLGAAVGDSLEVLTEP